MRLFLIGNFKWNQRENRQKFGVRIHQPVLVNMTKKTSSIEERAFDMDMAEYSEYGFKCNFWDVRQWVTYSDDRNSS